MTASGMTWRANGSSSNKGESPSVDTVTENSASEGTVSPSVDTVKSSLLASSSSVPRPSFHR